MIYDICIIGGGAAGLAAASLAVSENTGLKIVILERLARVGKKLLTTGNGRCNITNRDISSKHYHGTDPEFVSDAFLRFGLKETEVFFTNIGIPFLFEGDKAFPRSLQASSVVDALRFFCDEKGVETRCEQTVTAVSKRGNVFEIKAADTVLARTVIFATGLLSGGEKLGCDGSGMNILKKLGHGCTAVRPAIVQLKTETGLTKQLKGIKTDAYVTLKHRNTVIRREYGEVLFCDYGLSGPPILQISGSACTGDTICLDMAPETDTEALTKFLLDRKNTLSVRKNDEFLSGFINKRLGQVIIKSSGLSLQDDTFGLKKHDIELIASGIKEFCFIVTGNTGFASSQVSHGGVLTGDFDPRTLMSRKIPGLFAAGEVLDIDGDCGGFNLQWAWSSGAAAARAAAKFAVKNR